MFIYDHMFMFTFTYTPYSYIIVYTIINYYVQLYNYCIKLLIKRCLDRYNVYVKIGKIAIKYTQLINNILNIYLF